MIMVRMLQEAIFSASGRRGGDPPPFPLKALTPLRMELTRTRERKAKSRNLKLKLISKSSLRKPDWQNLEVVDAFHALAYYRLWFPPHPWSRNSPVLPYIVPAYYRYQHCPRSAKKKVLTTLRELLTL
jgi:hypothetical protein